jgi:putative transposase
MTAYLRRTCLPQVSAGAADTAMKTSGLNGVRRDKGVRTTIRPRTASGPGDLLDRDFTAEAPNRVWLPTYCRTWAGFVYVAFIVDVFAHRIVAWHASTSKATDLVMRLGRLVQRPQALHAPRPAIVRAPCTAHRPVRS